MVSGPEKEGVVWPDESQLAAPGDPAAAGDIRPYEDAAVDAPLVAVVPAPVAITARTADAELGTGPGRWPTASRVVLKPTTFKNDEV